MLQIQNNGINPCQRMVTMVCRGWNRKNVCCNCTGCRDMNMHTLRWTCSLIGRGQGNTLNMPRCHCRWSRTVLFAHVYRKGQALVHGRHATDTNVALAAQVYKWKWMQTPQNKQQLCAWTMAIWFPECTWPKWSPKVSSEVPLQLPQSNNCKFGRSRCNPLSYFFEGRERPGGLKKKAWWRRQTHTSITRRELLDAHETGRCRHWK